MVVDCYGRPFSSATLQAGHLAAVKTQLAYTRQAHADWTASVRVLGLRESVCGETRVGYTVVVRAPQRFEAPK